MPHSSSSSGWEFIDNSTLSYFIPLSTDFDVEESFRPNGESNASALDSIEHRESLFFDESVDVYLALKTPSVEEKVLRSSLRRLVVSLEARIVNNGIADRDSARASEIVYSGTVEETQEPIIISKNDDDDGEGCCFAVWKLSVFLSRPRIRLQSPSVVFMANAAFRPAELSLSTQLNDGFLPSGVASGLNLLESLGNDPGMNGIQPRLSALRVSRVAPLTQQSRDLSKPIKSSPKQLALRIAPAVHSRIRFARPNTTPPSPAIIAMLEIDFTPFFDCEMSLASISMSVADGKVEDLSSQPEMSLPMSCVAHDHITFLYRIVPEEMEALAKNPTRDLNIAIEMTALEQPGICTPKLTMAWTTNVDFTLPVNPGFGSALQPIQRSHRPSQLSINSILSLGSPAIARPDSLPSLEAANKADGNAPDLGITVTFTGPPPAEKIYPGQIFAWSVLVVNRSPPSSHAPGRKLALVVIPKRRRNETRVNRAQSISPVSTTTNPLPQSKAPHAARDVADAVLDDHIIHSIQRSSVVDSTEVVSLSADVRVGPLAPGSCHVVELRFMAVKTGILGIEAVRVVDLVSGEHVDIRELPAIIVESPEDEAAASKTLDLETSSDHLVAAEA
ncbi:hypothetical protein LQW54_006984 [Pestalotiopsis sp. IQ-011]